MDYRNLDVRKGITFLAVLVAGVCVLSACGQLSPATGVYWEMESASTRVVLVPTHHAAKVAPRRLSAALTERLLRADVLFVEIDVLNVTSHDRIKECRARSVDVPSKAVTSVLRSKLAAAVPEFKDAESMEQLQITTAINALGILSQKKAAISPEHGTDLQLIEFAKRNDRPVRGLEDPCDQFAAFSRASLAFDENALEDTLRFHLDDAMSHLVKQVERGWSAGDWTAIECAYVHAEERYSSLKKTEFLSSYERNAALAEAIAQGARNHATVFVAIGALHFIGESSVLRRLENMGYRKIGGPESRPQACKLVKLLR
ncbi:MAG: TraB/GumN family protein [Betaproteobacteria bacterium]